MGRKPDFSGWATRNNLKCADGRVIRANAFKVQDGARVPLVWDHKHDSIDDVLGHVLLENREDGVYAYGFFNDNPQAKKAKESVMNGDLTNMSIWANNLDQNGSDVLHGTIREVSLVLAGANPGAFIESVAAHGIPMDDYEGEGIFYTGEMLCIDTVPAIEHADRQEEAPEKKEEAAAPNKDDESGETIQDVINTMNEKQKNVLYALIGGVVQSMQEDDSDEPEKKEEEPEMKHNIFSDSNNEQENPDVLSHSAQKKIFEDARRLGSLREAVRQNVDGDIIAHKVPDGGMDKPQPGNEEYGIQSPSMLYPDYRSMTNIPEFISRDMSWVASVISGVHTTPFSRVKSMYANITEEEARARGYIKGSQKKSEVFSLLKRATGPTTIYKLQQMDRDDILDITDFDVVAWIRGEMRVMLDEEIARAILIGDGREPGGDGKIDENCIRPIVKDVDLFNVKADVDFSGATTNAQKARAFIDSVIRSHKEYKGSGQPVLYTTEDWITEMLLLEDQIGHKLYKSTAELATTMRVSRIVPVEVMEGYKLGETKDQDLLGVMVNLKDYNVGRDPKAGISMFDDFDIEYNRYAYLIETRMSGALTKPFSAVTFRTKKQD